MGKSSSRIEDRSTSMDNVVNKEGLVKAGFKVPTGTNRVTYKKGNSTYRVGKIGKNKYVYSKVMTNTEHQRSQSVQKKYDKLRTGRSIDPNELPF